MKLLAVLFLCISTNACAQVKISFEGDTLKGNIKRMTEYSYVWSWRSNIKRVYTYDETKMLQTVRFYGEHDTTARAKWLIRFDNNGHVIEKSLYCNNDTQCQGYTCMYDAQGREIEENFVRYLNLRCNDISDWLDGTITEWGVSGAFISVKSLKKRYNNAGRLERIQEEHFGIGAESDSDTTIETTSYKYYSTDKVAQVKKEIVRIKPESIDTGVEITSYSYDSNGNKVKENMINKEYREFEPDSTKTVFSYDAHNNLIEEKEYFFNARHNYSTSHSGTEIGYGLIYSYDRYDNVIYSNLYNLYRQIDGAEMKEMIETQKNENIEQDVKEYDMAGNMIKKTHINTIVFTREIEYY